MQIRPEMNELAKSDFSHASVQPAARRLRILFLMRHFMYLRNYESTLRALAARGHSVVLGYEETHEKVSDEITELAQSLAREIPNFELRQMPRRRDVWYALSHQMRSLRNYCRYLTPALARSKKCAKRAESFLMMQFRSLSDLPEERRGRAAERIATHLAWLEYAIPLDRDIVDAVAAVKPDVIAVTPLVDLNSTQVDYVKAARHLRIPSLHCVASWDNLTNKGVVLVAPDAMLVWNEAQRSEAIALHGMSADRIKITGAQLFDEWFARRPSRNRATFCRMVGLDSDRPFILYTCSSVFIARYESDFFKRWLAELRKADDERLRSIGVLVRPHPGSAKYAEQWDQPEIARAENVGVYPRSGGYPVTEAARADYFDSLYHCAAVVGINTSAMLEAGIVGKQCLTVLDSEIADSQDGMVHFAHLTSDNFLMTADGFAQHIRQLKTVLDRSDDGAERRRFIENFLRPRGAALPATPIVVDAIEQSVTLNPARLPKSPLVLVPLLFPVAVVLNQVARRLTTKKWNKISIGRSLAGRAGDGRKWVRRHVLGPASKGLSNAAKRGRRSVEGQTKRATKLAGRLRAAAARRLRSNS